MKKISKTIHLLISTLPISAYISYTISAALNLKDKCTTVQRAAAFGGGAIAVWAVLIGILCLANAIYKACAKKTSKDTVSQSTIELLNNPTKKSVLGAALVTLAPLFIIYIYLPAETFFHSYSDYNFPYWILLKSLILEFIFVWYTATYILSMLNAAVSRKVQALVLGFTLAIYVQYMFFNQNVGIVDGHPFVFKEHMVLATVNIIVWAALIIIPVVVATTNKVAAGAGSDRLRRRRGIKPEDTFYGGGRGVPCLYTTKTPELLSGVFVCLPVFSFEKAGRPEKTGVPFSRPCRGRDQRMPCSCMDLIR